MKQVDPVSIRETYSEVGKIYVMNTSQTGSKWIRKLHKVILRNQAICFNRKLSTAQQLSH